jgi:hypothetical protein
MAAQDSMITRDIAWDVGTLRATLFSEEDADPKGWWKELVGSEPELRQERSAPPAFEESGVWNRGRLALRVILGRTDWIHSPDRRQAPNDPLPVLGPFEEFMPPFQQLIMKWLAWGTCPQATRLAFSVELFRAVANREEGYRKLKPYLPCVELDIENSSEFIYQINRPRTIQLAASALKINRLSRWLVAVGAIGGMRFESVSGRSRLEMSPERRSCNLYLDINTVPGQESVGPQPQRGAVFSELVSLAKEVASKGDIP